ncbi:two-component sensor histidine kinase [Paenibacillus sp. 598K]|uniref:sensor histidine kinase n=1 Tax=Paenibacillus sp. 598K TaxID=1117987 RepID=UPI000FF9500F|nr:histidine kinase [Paenibacillus sp. 598K]GBF72941.1 two-component sensor histidine kinase [Paenibacillus sp. 598K]
MQTIPPYNSIYTKLVFTFLLVIGPLYVIVLQINRSDADSVKQGIAHSISSQSDFYLSNLELEFEQIIRFQQELGSGTELDTLSNAAEIMTTEEKRKSILSIHQQLLHLKSSSKHIEDAKAFLPLLGTVISANQPYFDMSVEEFQAMLEGASTPASPFIQWRNRLYIAFVQPRLIGIEDPPLLVAAEVNTWRMTQTMNRFQYNGAGGAALIGSSGSWLISGSSDKALIQAIAENTSQASAGIKLTTISVDGRNYIYNKIDSEMLGATFITYVPEADVLSPLKKNRDLIWYVSAFSLLVIIIVSYLIYNWIHRPLRTFILAFRQVGNAQLNVSISRNSKDEFAYLYEHFNLTVRKLRELVQEVFEQKYRTQLAEFKQLQSQISPHFLYNSFFTIYRMAKFKEVTNIERFTKFLGDYYRFITRDPQQHDEVTLGEEVRHARNYVDIQLFRFGDRIKVDFAKIPPSCEGLAVPRLIVQPVIENAFHYALEGHEENALLKVSFLESDGQLTIRVEDNGSTLDDDTIARLNQRMEQAQPTGGTTGLVNVNQRLRLKYGTQGLMFSRSSSGGLQVDMVLTIPVDRRQESRKIMI